MKYKLEVKNDVIVRTGPASEYQNIGLLKTGKTVIATDEKSGWYYLMDIAGWVPKKYFKLTKDLNADKIKYVDKSKSITKTEKEKAKEKKEKEQFQQPVTTEDAMKIYVSSLSSPSKVSSRYLTNNMNNVLGLPYQFPSYVDRKVGDNGVFGRKYAERIINNMPLLMITPGTTEFMSNTTQGAKQNTLDTLIKTGVDSNFNFGGSSLESFLDKPTKYYTFRYDPGYYEYVNAILNSTAVLMGIGDVTIQIGTSRKKKLRNFDWSEASNPLTKSFAQSSMEYICMYVDGVNSKSESFSNSTTESQLASKINSMSDTAKEIQFLLGSAAGEKMYNMAQDAISQAQDTINNIVDSTLSGNQIFKDLSDHMVTIANGGKLLFPQIYQDSSYSQTYEIDMKLRCPNPTPLNWYMDIMVPLGFLYALMLPRSTGNSGYTSPYLIRGFYKGIFNVDLGIITDMGVSKGGEGHWTNDGLPTVVDVSFTIGDLYNVLAMSKKASGEDWINFISNDQFMSFLANQVGVNINKTDAERSIDMYAMLLTSTGSQKVNFWKNSVKNTFNSKLLKMYKGAFKI